MALILGLKNTTTQTVPINGLINLGTVYRNLLWLSENDKIRTIIVDDVIRYDRRIRII